MIAGEPGADHGDPFVIKYLDSFYLYHTGATHGRRGVSVHRSQNLVNWEFMGYAVEPADSGWAWSDLWAPEVVYERGVFYMYISATRKHAGGPSGPWQQGEGDDAGRRLGLARSTSPLGPFVWDERPLVDTWSIDGHPFRDDDGSMWLFYSVRTDETGFSDGTPGTGTVCDRLLAPDRLAGHPRPVTFPSDAWEGVPTGDWYWNEAPYLLKRRGSYYQVYSGGCFVDSSYATGIAHGRSPLGPWRKDPANPILRGGERILGPGHHSFVRAPDVATLYAVYHGHVAGEQGRKVHLDRLYWAGDRPVITGPTEDEQPVPPRPVFDPSIPHWRAETWVRGHWVEVAGTRFRLEPPDVWHQLEAIQSDGRITVRIGGVLRSSRPATVEGSEPSFATDGDLAAQTVVSFLEDGAIHDLPASSSYVWRWRGAGPIELSLAVKGSVHVEVNGTSHEAQGDDDRYRLVRLAHDGDAPDIVVHAGAHGATVADLFVYAR